ncbi:10012_t:CDS:2, partial [Scutellospora calospora]
MATRTKRRQKPSKEDVGNESNSGFKAIIAENGKVDKNENGSAN